MSPFDIGVELFRKCHESRFVTPKQTIEWIEEAQRKAAVEIEQGFYYAENLERARNALQLSRSSGIPPRSFGNAEDGARGGEDLTKEKP